RGHVHGRRRVPAPVPAGVVAGDPLAPGRGRVGCGLLGENGRGMEGGTGPVDGPENDSQGQGSGEGHQMHNSSVAAGTSLGHVSTTQRRGTGRTAKPLGTGISAWQKCHRRRAVLTPLLPRALPMAPRVGRPRGVPRTREPYVRFGGRSVVGLTMW